MPSRSREPELLDQPGHGAAEMAAVLRDLARVNRWLGGVSSLWTPLAALLEENHLRAFTLLDAGAGGGDVAAALAARAARLGFDARFAGVDLDAVSVSYAASRAAAEARGSGDGDAPAPARPGDRSTGRQDQIPAIARAGAPGPTPPRLAFLRADARRLPFPDRSFDFVTCSMMFHHFEEAEAALLLAELARVARRAVIVNDLERHVVPWATISLLVPFAESAMVRHDAPLSVLRGWTANELASVAAAAGLGARSRVTRLFPYRLALTVRTSDGAGP